MSKAFPTIYVTRLLRLLIAIWSPRAATDCFGVSVWSAICWSGLRENTVEPLAETLTDSSTHQGLKPNARRSLQCWIKRGRDASLDFV